MQDEADDGDTANSLETDDMLFFQNENQEEDQVAQQDAREQEPFEIHDRKTLMSLLLRFLGVHYTKISVGIMVFYVIYILRTTKQIYITLIFLSTSKISYIIFGNSIISLFVAFFYSVVETFFGGLRVMEIETVQDKLRWSIADTCFALTVFRPEVNVSVIGMFLLLILAKALHWATDLRGNHLRVTDDVFYATPDHRIKGKWTNFIPIMKWSHLKFLSLCWILLCVDISTLYLCTSQLLVHGPSAYIYFGFEAAILLSSALSTCALFSMHVVDGLINILQRFYTEKDPMEDVGFESETQSSRISSDPEQCTIFVKIFQRLTCVWRENRATLSILIELVTQSAKFLFSFTLFSAVLLYYGLPFSILREVYFSYQKLRDRLSSFASYQRLTRNMNDRFENVESDAELDSVGRTCIICREMMDSHGVFGGCKKLPICGHIFHKHCLREWLVQQQSCPTCRADIQLNEIKAKAQRLSRANEVSVQTHTDMTNQENAENETSIDEHERLIVHHDLPMTVDETNNLEGTKCFFPGLFRIVETHAASIVNFVPSDLKDAYFNMKHIKTLESGKVIICSEKRRFCWISSGAPMCAYFLRSPDGWIQENACTPVHKLRS